ncbi:putative transposase [Trichonephila inaurata madagascariensis]|uniref:Putative transposase n=1 Tax=Trichonephila inaurata madagascariensis TaxID=2747483 RepID=A0A8X6YLQ1_9ARAC|nr:putative transposase [Trichonephila inaurata madagascariensis]
MTQCKHRQHFNSRSAPTAFMIWSMVDRFEELGSVTDRPGRGVHQNIRTEDNVKTVWQSVADGPSVSIRRRSSQLGISRRTLRRILKLDLKMYPYKIQIVQTLLPEDYLLREIFGEHLSSDSDLRNMAAPIKRLVRGSRSHAPRTIQEKIGHEALSCR